LQTIAPGAPTHIVKTVVDEEQSSTGNGFDGRFLDLCAGLGRQTGTFILNLPNQPMGGHNPAHPQTFRGIAAVAMAHGVYKGLMET